MSADPETQAAPAAADDKQESKKNGKDRKRDETPIEELYDLTQPIPKVSFVAVLTFESTLWVTFVFFLFRATSVSFRIICFAE